MTTYYGLITPQDIRKYCEEVALAYRTNVTGAVECMVEFGAAETQMGTYQDRRIYREGAGWAQIEPGRLRDTQRRMKPHHRGIAYQNWGVELDRLTHQELAFSPLLSAIVTRVALLIIEDPIPAHREGRADYWKTWWNSSKGAGDDQHYLASCKTWIDERGC